MRALPRTPRSLAVLVVATALGLGPPVARVAARRPPFVFDVPAQADEAFAALRARLAPGERIGVLLATGNDGGDIALWYSAQYTLAPALVTPVHARDCQSARPTPRCPVDKVERVAFATRSARGLALLESLDLVPVAREGNVHVARWIPRGGPPAAGRPVTP